jgi:hypothetical protein
MFPLHEAHIADCVENGQSIKYVSVLANEAYADRLRTGISIVCAGYSEAD